MLLGALLPVLRLQLNTFGDRINQSHLRMALIEFGQYPFLVCLILVPAGIDFRNQQIEIRIRSQGAFRHQLFAARRALLVPRTQGRDNTIGTEAMQTFLGRHRFPQHVQTNWTHELAVQTARRYSDFGCIGDCLLWQTIQFVQRQIPCFILQWLDRGHFCLSTTTTHHTPHTVPAHELLHFLRLISRRYSTRE